MRLRYKADTDLPDLLFRAKSLETGQGMQSYPVLGIKKKGFVKNLYPGRLNNATCGSGDVTGIIFMKENKFSPNWNRFQICEQSDVAIMRYLMRTLQKDQDTKRQEKDNNQLVFKGFEANIGKVRLYQPMSICDAGHIRLYPPKNAVFKIKDRAVFRRQMETCTLIQVMEKAYQYAWKNQHKSARFRVYYDIYELPRTVSVN